MDTKANQILIKYQNDKKWIANQILNTISEILMKQEISNYNKYCLSLKKVNIINEQFMLLIFDLINFDSQEKESTIKVIFKDDYKKVYKEKDFNLIDLFQTIIDDKLIEYNYNKKMLNNYFFISNFLPKKDEINKIETKIRKMFNVFFYQILPNKILSKMYTYDIPKSPIYNVKLSEPQLSLGYFPLKTQSEIKIMSNISYENENIEDCFIIDFNFFTYHEFNWIYNNNEFLSDNFYKRIMLDELEKVTNDKNKVFSNDYFSISFKNFDNLNKFQEFIKLKENQCPDHIIRFMNLYNQGFIKSISRLNFDDKNKVIECCFLNNKEKIFFGENGIVTSSNNVIYSPTRKDNNTLIEAKKNLLKLNQLPIVIDYIEKPQDFNDLVINDMNLIIDVYNKHKSMKNLENYAKLNEKLEEKLKMKGL